MSSCRSFLRFLAACIVLSPSSFSLSLPISTPFALAQNATAESSGSEAAQLVEEAQQLYQSGQL